MQGNIRYSTGFEGFRGSCLLAGHAKKWCGRHFCHHCCAHEDRRLHRLHNIVRSPLLSFQAVAMNFEMQTSSASVIVVPARNRLRTGRLLIIFNSGRSIAFKNYKKLDRPSVTFDASSNMLSVHIDKLVAMLTLLGKHSVLNSVLAVSR